MNPIFGIMKCEIQDFHFLLAKIITFKIMKKDNIISNYFKTGIVMMFFLFVTMPISGQTIINAIKKDKVLSIGLSGNQPPFSLESLDGSLIGYEVDLANKLAEAMGVRLKLVRMPFPELLPSLASSEIDMVMSGITMSTARNMDFAFVGPYISTGKSLLTKSEKYATIKSYQELNMRKVKIVALRGSTSEYFVIQNIPDALLEVVDGYEEAIDKLRNGKSDLMIADYAQCIYATLKYSEDNFFVLDYTFTNERIGIALSPADPLFINLVGNFLGELRENGELETLEDKWFRSGSWLLQAK